MESTTQNPTSNSNSDSSAQNGNVETSNAQVSEFVRKPMYLVLSFFGFTIIRSAMSDTWAKVGQSDSALSVTGFQVPGWGIAAAICGIAIIVIGLIGYFVNPYNDPEGLWLAGFGLLTAVAAVAKIMNPASLIEVSHDYPEATVSAGFGLWMILIVSIPLVVGGTALYLSGRK